MCDSEFNVEERVLCSDGGCIGLVGFDGRCKVCGLPYAGDETLPTASAGPTLESLDEVSDAEAEIEAGGESSSAVALVDGESDRVCCPDDNCIGILGSDSRCGTCGREGGEVP